jgi:hypothetical protein
MSAPEPNSPEALKAARKIKELFFCFVVLNLVLFGVVMCSRRETPAPAPAAPGTAAPEK